MKRAVIYSSIISLVLLSGCETPFTLTKLEQIRPFKMKLTAEGGNLVNDKGRNANCTAYSDTLKKGCFVAGLGEVLELEFKLTKRSEGKDWRFTALQICAGTTKPGICALDSTQQADWLVIAKRQLVLVPGDGTVDLSGFSDGKKQLRRFTVVDINGHPGDYVYNIQACPVDEPSTSPDCVWMDPGGSNRGR